MSWNNWAVTAFFFFPLWARVFTFLRFAPLFSSAVIPPRVRVVLSLIIAWWYTPILQASGVYDNLPLTLWFMFVLGEALIGLLQALILLAFYNVLQMASHFFSYQMGMTMAQISDPTTDMETPVAGQILTAMAIWIFLSNESIFYLFWIGIRDSIEKVNVLGLVFLGDVVFRDWLITFLSEIFYKSFLLALPVIGVLFLVNFVTGLLAKAAPQINLLVMIFPVSISLGLYVLLRGLPSLALSYSVILESSFRHLRDLLFFLGRA